MLKLNFLSNSRIRLFINDDDPMQIRPDQIPTLLLGALFNATRGETILSLSLFTKDLYVNHVRAIIVTWDGISATKVNVKLFGDCSFEYIKNGESTCWGIL